MKIEKVSENEYKMGSEPWVVWMMVGLMLASMLSIAIIIPFAFLDDTISLSFDSPFVYFFSLIILIQIIASYFIIKRNRINLPKSIIKTNLGTVEIKGISFQLTDIDAVEVCYQRVRFGKTHLRDRKRIVSANYHVGLQVNRKYKALASSITLNDANHIAEVLSDFLKKSITQTTRVFGPL